MNKPKILVTGATGKTGAAVVSQLLEQGWPVRAIVRSRDRRSEQLDRLGAETVVADLFDPDQLLAAMRGTQRAYYCPPMHPQMIESATAFAHAAQEAKLEAIVGLGQWLASPNHPSIHTRQNWQAEQLFAQLPNIAHVKINPGYFADNYLRLLDFAALLGVFPVFTGDSLNAPPANEDIAAVAVAALKDPDRHAGKRYRPTGPELLSAYDMVGIIEKVVGHPILPVNLPWWLFTRAARMQGVTAFVLSSLRFYFEEHKQGAFAYGAPTEDVYLLTGRPAESFETTVRRYAALPFAHQTFTNRLRAFINFNLVPFSPGYNLDRYEREQRFPMPSTTLFAMQDEHWKTEHSPQAAPMLSR
jgi:uncharacterized protein YbjT (DUF2867 family)